MVELVAGVSSGSGTNWAASYLTMSRHIALKTATVSEIRIYCNIGTYYKIGIYADNGGSPGAVLARGNGLATESGWCIASVNCDITKDLYYWLAFVEGANSPSIVSETGNNIKYKAADYETFSFSDNPTGLSSYSNCHVLMGAWGTEAAGGDPEGSLIGGKLIRGGLLLHGVLGR